MVNEKSIRAFSDQIVREFQPDRIILFGSYVYGRPTADSDVDLLIVMPFDGKPTQKAVEILKRTKPHIPVELVVRTPGQVEKRLKLNDFFLREILEKGRVLYESPHRRMG